MNKLIDMPVLHNLWGSVKNSYYKNNFKYLLLPMIYIVIILLTIPKPNTMVVKYSYTEFDSYTTIEVPKELTNDEKINVILSKYNLTRRQFNVVSAIVLAEAENCYDDAYAVINTIYNRTHAKNWVRSVNGHFGKGKGNSLYYQAISPRQFTVYSSGSYKRHLNKTNRKGYQAIIDFLYSEEIMHDYLSFRSHSIKIKNSESFSSHGNNYFNKLSDKNRV